MCGRYSGNKISHNLWLWLKGHDFTSLFLAKKVQISLATREIFSHLAKWRELALTEIIYIFAADVLSHIGYESVLKFIHLKDTHCTGEKK